jgi:hypothetical protein
MNNKQKLLVLMGALLLPLIVKGQGISTFAIDEVLGRSGQKMGDVYKVGFPRTDLHVTVHGLTVKPGLALASWAAFAGADDIAMVMGDVVLSEDEFESGVGQIAGSGLRNNGDTQPFDR